MITQVPVPILLSKEGKWFVASCPILDIATQGRTETEVRDNLEDLIYEYLRDPDTAKPSLDDLMYLSLANILLRIPKLCSIAKLRPLPQRRVIEILESNGFIPGFFLLDLR